MSQASSGNSRQWDEFNISVSEGRTQPLASQYQAVINYDAPVFLSIGPHSAESLTPPQAMQNGVLPQSPCVAGQNQHQRTHRFVQWVQLPFQAHPAYAVAQYVCSIPHNQEPSEFCCNPPTSPGLRASGHGSALVFPEVLSLADAMTIFQCAPEAEMARSSAAEEQCGAVPGPAGGDSAQTQEDGPEDTDWDACVQRLLAAWTSDHSVPSVASAEHDAMDFFYNVENYGHLCDFQLFGQCVSIHTSQDSEDTKDTLTPSGSIMDIY
ncbi:hypothetical protein SKAU_G00273220 [Synaphobranchus kaupii]|uniref:Uncharacterized protein n=1 Tax=Synaphobranchus kaupii TaxID=118154 RepID=A0A9Q1INS5_SYNKA|nr:hypothetical protein SKAU_G00273220 [Synaphobranchus kaupii]